MGLGTFSGGGLGFGVAFVLEDYFSDAASTIERRMGQLGGYTQEMADSIERSMNQMKIGAALVAVGSAILAPFVAGIGAASDLEENINKNRVAFGEYSKEVEDFAAGALDKFGIDKIQALDMTSLFGDMGTGMGFDKQASAEMSKTLVGLAGDLSSFKNISADMSQTALKGIFTGETESLKNLGIVMTEANLQSYAATQGINKNFKDLSQTEKVMLRFNYVMDMSKNAMGDFARTSDGYANSKRVFEGSIKEISATLGGILMPIVAKAFQSMTGLMKNLKAFSETPMGRNVMIGVAALGAFLVVGGLALILIGGLRFGVLKMADAFGASTKAKIIDTIATKGLSAGLREMGASLWISLGPLLLIVAAIAVFAYVANEAWDMVTQGEETMVRFGMVLFYLLGPIGWIIGAVAGIYRGFKELNEWKGDQGGIIGFFMRVAGVIEAVGEIWESFNGETFTLTDELASKLEDMGILDFVIELGTWVSRIKMFLSSVIDTVRDGFNDMGQHISEVWDRLKQSFEGIGEKLSSIWEKLKVLFAPVVEMIGKLLEKLGFGKGKLETWGDAGKLVGDIIVGAISGILDVLIFLIEVIVWVIDAVLWLVDTFLSGAQWIKDGISGIIDFIFEMIDALFQVASMAYDVGVSFMTNIWEGLKSMWESVWAWLQETVGGAINILADPLGAIGDGLSAVGNFLGIGGDEEGAGTGKPAGAGIASKGKGGDGHHMQSSKSPNVFNNSTNNNGGGGGQTVVNNYLDGELISQTMVDKKQLNDARK